MHLPHTSLTEEALAELEADCDRVELEIDAERDKNPGPADQAILDEAQMHINVTRARIKRERNGNLLYDRK